MGAQTGKRSNNFPHGDVSDVERGFLYYLLKSFSCCAGSLLVVYICRCRTDQKIGMYSRRYKNAFPVFAGQREDCVAYMISGSMIKQTVFAAAGGGRCVFCGN